MPLDLAILATNVAHVAVPYGTDTISVSFHPSVATPARMKAMTTSLESADDEDNLIGFLAFLSDLIADWDITSGADKVPTTPEGLEQVPMAVLQKIMQTILSEAQEPGEAPSTSVAG